MSPLQEAIMRNDLGQTEQILTAFPSAVNETDDGEILPSFLAAQYGSLELLKYIVEYSRASLDEYDSQHRNILHYVTLSGDVQKARYLTERCGMSPLEADVNLITPYELAWKMFPDTLYPYFLSVVGTPYPDMYHNPVRRGFFPDPSIVRVGEYYYMVNSTFIFFPCIPVSRSKDLLHWEIIGHAVTDPEWSQLGSLEGGRGFWAPDISYDGGRFYITATYRLNDTGWPVRRQMVVSSDKPEGPYSKPAFIEEDGIDPSIFHEDGRHYMLLNRGARIFELSSDCTEKISDAKLLYYGSQKHAPEGPHLLKKDGFYYLFLAEGGTGPGHRITVSRSRELTGIYEPCPYNPIMRQNDPDAGIQRCGHGKPVQTPDGRWYMVYLCGRTLDGKYSMLGRETALDPITWTPDGWPLVNSLKGPSVLAPKPFPERTAEQTEDSGFRAGVWPKDWMTPREPQEGAVQILDGAVRLLSSPAPLYSVDSRNLFLHRQESFRFDAEILLELPALQDDQEAGMVCYYDENTYVSFMAARRDGALMCITTEHIGHEFISREAPLGSELPERLRFKVEADGLKRVFTLSLEDGSPLHCETLANVYYLCDEGIRMGKRFTGAVFGTAAYGKEPFAYLLRSVTIHNQED